MADRYLFKAKHVHVSKGNEHLNGQWVIGYLSGNNYINDEISDVLIDPSTICQCTGLKDKNGNLIWENDIVERVDRRNGLYVFREQPKMNCKVVWTDRHGYDTEPSCGYFDKKNALECEVIGNIFDNQPDSISEAWKQQTMSRFERVE